MIKLINVSKYYSNNIKALDDVSLEVARGEFVFVIGASGAGKSTLIKLLLKEVNPTKGEIYLDNERITKVSNRRIPEIRKQIGVVFQDFRLLDDRNVYNNIGYVLDLQGKSSKEKKLVIEKVLNLVGLEDKSKCFPNQLSGGEQQRVSIARAMVNNPKLLIADEPTGNLDPVTSDSIIEALVEINKTGTTVIISTHAKEIVNRMRQRVIHLESGHVVRDESDGLYDY